MRCGLTSDRTVRFFGRGLRNARGNSGNRYNSRGKTLLDAMKMLRENEKIPEVEQLLAKTSFPHDYVTGN